MIAALERLQAEQSASALPKQMVASGISSQGDKGFRRLFASHPDLSERIDALRSGS
jgi:heat shock protein HtpX